MNKETMLKEVKVHDAIGMALAHDLTQIVPGRFKGRLFKKGHVIREEDIEPLLNIGKEHIYILDLREGFLHEDEAARRMAEAVRGGGKNVRLTAPHEGKVSLLSDIHGLAKIHAAFVDEANAVDQVIISTLTDNTVVQAGQPVVGARVVPLVVEEETVCRIERMAVQWKERIGAPVVSVLPFVPLRVGLITTGGEVFSGRIADKFGPVVREKVAAYGSEVVEQRYAPDDRERIAAEIRYFAGQGVDLILLTGGMSVDPDDRTPGAIKSAGADIVSYGAPMLPGSMLMTAYLPTGGGRRIPVLGLPGCVMHDPHTSFDVLLPRICAGETIVRTDIASMGYGGLYSC